MAKIPFYQLSAMPLGYQELDHGLLIDQSFLFLGPITVGKVRPWILNLVNVCLKICLLDGIIESFGWLSFSLTLLGGPVSRSFRSR